MNASLFINSLINNKIFLYVCSRYLIYGIHFVILLTVASKLGPYYYGIWGFVLMLISYFSIFNFGIANSLNVLMVQNKDNSKATADYVASSMICILLLSLAVLIIGVITPLCHFQLFEKYQIESIFYIICVIAIFDYFNKLFSNIYRVKNRLLELSFYQSTTALLSFFIIFLFTGEMLLYCLLFAYLAAQLISFIFFLIRGCVPFSGKASYTGMYVVFKKGFYLFLYNSCFYLILTSTSTIISYFYTITEYGYYTFSYNLGNAVLLILEAFAFVLFPKMLDKFYTGDTESIIKTIEQIKENYVVLTHGLMYMAFALFPIFLLFFPQYQDALKALWFTALAVMLTVNSFGYNTLLIAKNRERLIALISFVSLLVNIFTGLLLVYFKFPFYVIVFSVMASYITFAILCVFFAFRELDFEQNAILMIFDIFPLPLLIPFIIALGVAIMDLDIFSFIPLTVFILMNMKNLKKILNTINEIRTNPHITDINKS